MRDLLDTRRWPAVSPFLTAICVRHLQVHGIESRAVAGCIDVACKHVVIERVHTLEVDAHELERLVALTSLLAKSIRIPRPQRCHSRTSRSMTRVARSATLHTTRNHLSFIMQVASMAAGGTCVPCTDRRRAPSRSTRSAPGLPRAHRLAAETTTCLPSAHPSSNIGSRSWFAGWQCCQHASAPAGSDGAAAPGTGWGGPAEP